MHRVALAILMALTLVASSAGAFSSTALADQHEHISEYQVLSKLYYPSVPNGAMIGETGPWYGTLTVQNLQAEPIIVWVLPDGHFDPDAALMEFQMYSYESRTLPVGELDLESSETSLMVAAMYQDIWGTRDNATGLASRDALGVLDKPEIAGSLKQTAPIEGHEGDRTNGDHEIVDGYTAIAEHDIGWGSLSSDCPSDASNLINCADLEGISNPDGVSYLPLAQTNNGWNTILNINNIEGAIDDDSNVTVELIPTDGSENDDTWTAEQSLAPGETWNIDIGAEVGEGWTGAVRIESNAGVAATASRFKTATNMMVTNTSAPSHANNDGGTALSAPLIFKDWYGWNTGFSLFNESERSNALTVTFYDENGDEVDQTSETIAPQSHAIIYMPSEAEDVDEEGWIGSAVVESANARPFHAAVDQVNYYNGAAMSYTIGSQAADDRLGNEILGLPLFQKTDQGDTSGIFLFNPDRENSVQVEAAFEDGPTFETFEIEPRSSRMIYAPDEEQIPTGTSTSVIVQVTGGSGQVIGISNNVNYEVNGDGAVAFPLGNAQGLHR